MQCSPFFTDDMSVIWREGDDFFPFHARARRCTTVALNSFTRFGILLGLLLSVLRLDARYLIISFLFPILAVGAFYGMKTKDTLREGFLGGESLVAGTAAAAQNVADVIGIQERTMPNAPNPFMTPLMDEINNNPAKPPAVYVNSPAVKAELDAYFQTSIYSDPGDVFQRNQGQRQFVAPPVTSVPNDVDSLQNWLYRTPGQTCKEGNTSACVPHNNSGRFVHLT
jgi:hypothetical protein